MRIKVIINPNAANKRVIKKFPLIKKVLDEIIKEFDYELTQAPLHATYITKEALKQGYDTIVSIGGDGILNEVVNGFFEEDKLINEETALGIICIGTGSDFVKTIGIPRKDLYKAVEKIKLRDIKKCDIGKVTFVNHKNEPITSYFINIADCGVGGEVVDRVNRTTKLFGGFLSFLWGTLISYIKYKHKNVSIKIDDKEIGNRLITDLIVANGCYFGGGMKIAPQARIDDGLFEVVIINKLKFIEGISIMRKIYQGKIINTPNIEYYKCQKIEIDSTERVLINLDGEQPGILPMKIEIIPKVINIIV